MGGIVGALAGAPYAASQTGGEYQNAASMIANQYSSPEAAMFSKMQAAALRPQFAQQEQQLGGQLAAQGLGPSGAGRAAFGNLAADQAGTLAGVTAPLYQQGMQQYGDIIGAMPGAQASAYQDAIQNFYNMVQQAGAAAAGIPGGGGGGGSTATPSSMVGPAPTLSAGWTPSSGYYG